MARFRHPASTTDQPSRYSIDSVILDYAGVGKDYLACGTAQRFGTCKNRAGLRRRELDAAVLGALKDNLLQPDLVEEFMRSSRSPAPTTESSISW